MEACLDNVAEYRVEISALLFCVVQLVYICFYFSSKKLENRLSSWHHHYHLTSSLSLSLSLCVCTFVTSISSLAQRQKHKLQDINYTNNEIHSHTHTQPHAKENK